MAAHHLVPLSRDRSETLLFSKRHLERNRTESKLRPRASPVLDRGFGSRRSMALGLATVQALMSSKEQEQDWMLTKLVVT